MRNHGNGPGGHTHHQLNGKQADYDSWESQLTEKQGLNVCLGPRDLFNEGSITNKTTHIHFLAYRFHSNGHFWQRPWPQKIQILIVIKWAAQNTYD